MDIILNKCKTLYTSEKEGVVIHFSKCENDSVYKVVKHQRINGGYSGYTLIGIEFISEEKAIADGYLEKENGRSN